MEKSRKHREAANQRCNDQPMTIPPKLRGDKASAKSPPPLPEDANRDPIMIAVAVGLICLLLLALLLLLSQNDRSGGSASAGSGDPSSASTGTNEGGSGDHSADKDGDQESSAKSQTGQNDQAETPASSSNANNEEEGPTEPELNQDQVGDEGTSGSDGTESQLETPPDDSSIAEIESEEAPASNPSSGMVAIGNVTGGAEFFGVESGHGPVSFVIDSSSSMGGGRFTKARDQMIASVKGIRSGQRFNAFFYNDWYQPFKNGKLISPSERVKSEFEDWAGKIYPSGGTNPFPAVEAAVDSGTSTIFLLSDGEFNMSSTDQIIQVCSDNDVIVHTYSLNNNSSTLRKIAKECGGVFTNVR